jgi:hypothetical protein
MFGAGFFLISYYEAPILQGLHTGRGFWVLAADAELYFRMAAEASRSGLSFIQDTDPSPLYLRTIAVWLDLAGVTPASVVPFNVLCYAAMVLMLSTICGSGLASTVTIIAITVSPAMVIVGTQVLKDTLCVLLIITSAAGVSMWTEALGRQRPGRMLPLVASACLICFSIFMFAGIRTYFAVLMLVSLVATSVWAVVKANNAAQRRRIAAAYCLLVAAAGFSASWGGGPYFDYYTGLTRLSLRQPDRPIVVLDAARARFIASGGQTNFGDELSLDMILSGQPQSIAMRIRNLSIGVAAIFVPISLLKGLSVITFSGGRGILLITDMDTLILDLALIFGLYLLVTRWAAVPPFTADTVFVLTLAVLTTVAMAYVVTNFGTLFRLRLLAITPLWLLPALALSQSVPVRQTSSARDA